MKWIRRVHNGMKSDNFHPEMNRTVSGSTGGWAFPFSFVGSLVMTGAILYGIAVTIRGFIDWMNNLSTAGDPMYGSVRSNPAWGIGFIINMVILFIGFIALLLMAVSVYGSLKLRDFPKRSAALFVLLPAIIIGTVGVPLAVWIWNRISFIHLLSVTVLAIGSIIAIIGGIIGMHESRQYRTPRSLRTGPA